MMQNEATLQQLSARPIGVFDSGIGGLSVLDNLVKVLPDEKFVYLADTANVPYGDKTSDFLQERVGRIFDWLITEQQVKAVVLACNTSCPFIPENLPLPVLDPISVASSMASTMTAVGKMGVIATAATVDGGLYKQSIEEKDPKKTVLQAKAVKLVDFIEAGSMQTSEAQTCLDEILKPLVVEKIEALVLGCTHYPFAETEIKSTLKAQLGHDIPVLNPATGMGLVLQAILEELTLSNTEGNSLGDQVNFFVTGQPNAFIARANTLPLGALQVSSAETVTL